MSYTDHFKLKECIQNPGNYFKKVEETNFDFIHHECRGNPLHKDEKHYFTINSTNFKNAFRNQKRKKLWVQRDLINILKVCNCCYF